jgi:Nif-specific regulatory protein
LFQQADGGTLFLDEIGELPLDSQARLLRAIEGHGFRPVGATSDVTVDVRVLAATNRDLEAEARRGAFRTDLLYRLQVITLSVPPLRDRMEDLEMLAQHFLARLSREHQRPLRLSDAALKRLRGFSWPGNVRQLAAVLESAAVLSDGPVLRAEDLSLPDASPATASLPLNLDELETWAIRQALRQTEGNVSRAARLLGLSRDTLTAKVKRKGIDRLAP